MDRALAVVEHLDDKITITGRVVHGDHRGRLLGFPTANIALAEGAVDDGVWAGWYTGRDEVRSPAAISVGRRPTFYAEGVALLEAHLLGFDGDLYGDVPVVTLAHRIRDQIAFSGIEQLQAQLRLDVERAADLLGT